MEFYFHTGDLYQEQISKNYAIILKLSCCREILFDHDAHQKPFVN
jgi:hypothetical protein